MRLTPDQLTAIDRHLRKENWLLNEDLITELTDHYIAGLEDRLAQGIPFEVALRDIHRGFGSRKGLLAMEEEYQKSQAKNNGRIIRRQIADYFRLPRLRLTILLLVLVYSLIRVLPQQLTFTWSNSWLFIGVLSSMTVFYILTFVQLIKGFKQTGKAKLFSQELRLLVQVVTSLMSLVFYIHVWIPVEEIMIRYPFPASMVITLFTVIELATIELLYNQLYRKQSA